MIVIRRLGLTAYPQALEQMRAHVAARAVKRAEAPDELWLTEHEPVFTLGFAGRPEHLLAPGAIPVVATERGGQVTYHGPGQVVAYLLLDLRRRKLGVRALVCRLEQGIIDCLAGYGLTGLRKAGAPGIYVRSSLPAPEISAGRLQATGIAQGGEASAPLAKIASIGLKVSGGLTWHGLAVNGCMDLEPFQRIDPCGYPGLRITDICSEANAHFTRGAGEAFLHPTNGNRDSAMAERDADALEDLSDRLGTTLANAIDG